MVRNPRSPAWPWLLAWRPANPVQRHECLSCSGKPPQDPRSVAGGALRGELDGRPPEIHGRSAAGDVQALRGGEVPHRDRPRLRTGDSRHCGLLVPRRSVHDIVTSMAAEAERDLPKTIDDGGSADAVERFPVRIAAIADAEIERLEKKQKRAGLSSGDLDRLRKVSDLSAALRKRVHKPSTDPQRRAGRARRQEGAIEKLARERREAQENGSGTSDHVSPAHAPPTPAESSPKEPERGTAPSEDRAEPFYAHPRQETPKPTSSEPVVTTTGPSATGLAALDAVRRIAARDGIDIGDAGLSERPSPGDRASAAQLARAREALAS